jgi:hypothetical protein
VMSYAPHDEAFERAIQDIFLAAGCAQKLENARWLLANGAERLSLRRVLNNVGYQVKPAVADFVLTHPEFLVEKFCCWEVAGTPRNIVDLFSAVNASCPDLIAVLEKHKLPCGKHLLSNILQSMNVKSLNLLYEKKLLADDARARDPLIMSPDVVQWFYTHPRFAPDIFSREVLRTKTQRSTTIEWLCREKIADPEDLLQGAMVCKNLVGIKTLIECGFQIPQNALDSMQPTFRTCVLTAIEEKKTADAKKVAKEVVASIVDTAMANVASES